MSNYPPANPSPLNYAPPARNDLRQIATRQRAIMLCILSYIGLFVLQFLVPGPLRLVLGLAAFAVSIAGAVFVFMLCLSVYNTALGVVFGILTLVPLVGLIILLVVNGKATNILRSHGIKVGLLGADMSQVPDTTTIP